MRPPLSALLLLAAVVGPAGAEAAFWVPPTLGANMPTRVVAVGDSITAGKLGDTQQDSSRAYPVVLEELLSPRHPGVEVINEGIGGLGALDLLDRLPGFLDADHPIVVLILIGTNDASNGHSPDLIVDLIRQMVQLAKARGVIPIVASIMPNFRPFGAQAEAIIEAANALLPGMAAAEDIRLVDLFDPFDAPAFFPDGLHPDQAGYDLMAALWRLATDSALDDALTLLPQAYVLRFNKETFRPGERLQVDLTLGDRVTSGAVDVYFGLLLPPQAGPSVGCPIGQAFAFLADDFARVVFACFADVATRAAPLRAHVQFVPPISLLTVVNFWAAALLPGFPTGEYIVFFSITTAGHQTDVLVTSTHSFTLAP